ncbi:MAG TPA: DAK2 domain-containing protein, partial [Fimbriimonadaceae bacterium]|nr:DAK2 domain-containing protein [Fimbriimonadaceae bacterium]
RAKVAIADGECGEFITSLDMAGVSLTLFWVDDELEALWNAPADSSGFRRGFVHSEPDRLQIPERASVAKQAHSGAGGDSRAVSSALEGLRRAHAALLDSERELGQLDSVAGDGDHGLCMVRGAAGALQAAERVAAEGGSLARLLTEAGEAWADQGGGASGALWGAALAAAGDGLDDEPDTSAVSRAVDAALAAVRRLGKAEVGDKTMVDAFAPFAEELGRSISSGMDLGEAWQSAALRATDAAAGTAELAPRMGRARTHGERSIGHCDPGAISFALVVNAVGPGRQN